MPFDVGQSASLAQGNRQAPAMHVSGTGQETLGEHAIWPQTPHCSVHVASSGQFVFEAHWGVQNPWPPVSCVQCCGVPSADGEQSWSMVHGAQYCRGKHTARVGPNERVTAA